MLGRLDSPANRANNNSCWLLPVFLELPSNPGCILKVKIMMGLWKILFLFYISNSMKIFELQAKCVFSMAQDSVPLMSAWSAFWKSLNFHFHFLLSFLFLRWVDLRGTMLCLFSILLSAIPPPKKTMNLQGEPLNYYEHNFNWNIVFFKGCCTFKWDWLFCDEIGNR